LGEKNKKMRLCSRYL